MTIAWRDMDRAALDTAYSNTGSVSNVREIALEFEGRSAAFYADCGGERDVKYGPAPRECFDFFPATKAGAATFVFLHGGYWQSQVKENFAFIAEGPLACDMNVALAEYTLAPDASMTQIVAEIGRLLDFLVARGHSKLILCGHSAGGHLTAMHRGHPAVSHALAVSGLFDLEPISAGSLNDKLGLSAEEIARYSPMQHIDSGAPMVVSVGDAELPELIRHSREYASACTAAGERASYVPVPGANHFSILFDLARPDGVQLSALMQAMRG
ncbi:alpha/beta hydrolase [Caballeronia sp.]|uniref:alpha/beta hydrolase n=1 Tax=Caballeronia sp. TaxID=1931223 RepID=UPI003C62A83A